MVPPQQEKILGVFNLEVVECLTPLPKDQHLPCRLKAGKCSRGIVCPCPHSRQERDSWTRVENLHIQIILKVYFFINSELKPKKSLTNFQTFEKLTLKKANCRFFDIEKKISSIFSLFKLSQW